MTVRRDDTAGGRWIDRRAAAALVTASYFPTTKRAIERWPLRGRMVNGKVLLREAEVIACAKAILDSAPATAPPRH